MQQPSQRDQGCHNLDYCYRSCCPQQNTARNTSCDTLTLGLGECPQAKICCGHLVVQQKYECFRRHLWLICNEFILEIHLGFSRLLLWSILSAKPSTLTPSTVKSTPHLFPNSPLTDYKWRECLTVKSYCAIPVSLDHRICSW